MRFPNLIYKYYSDTILFKIKLMRGSTTARVFIYGKGVDDFYPINRIAQVGRSRMSFIHNIGVPRDLVTDGSK